MMHKSDFYDRISKFQELINQSSKIVFFWWAWTSTECWIPDFRSKDWLYNQQDVKFDKYQPEYLLSHSCLYNEPKVFFEYYRQKLDCRWIKPNITHQKLVELEESWKLSTIITQNIDWLHQKAWSKNVQEIHWTTQIVYCDKCMKLYDSDILFTNTDPIPYCECGWMLRPNVTLYEEQLPKDARYNSVQALNKADLFIIGGTSLMVYPANSLVRFFRGSNIVIINKDKTPHDKNASLIFHESIWKVFNEIII